MERVVFLIHHLPIPGDCGDRNSLVGLGVNIPLMSLTHNPEAIWLAKLPNLYNS